MKLRSWLRGLIMAVTLMAIVIGLWWFWYTHRNYGALFERQAGSVTGFERSFASESNGVRLYDLIITSNTGLQTDARISVPAHLDPPLSAASARVPGILLAAGLHTGKKAVNLIPSRTDMIVMALDYGWSGAFDISSVSNMKRDLTHLRATTLNAVPRALLALDALKAEPGINPDQVVMVGVSYGCYVALPAAALDPDVDELILVQGGAQIGPTIAGNAALWKSPLPAPVAGWIGELVFAPFDPVRWSRRLGPRRLTMMASRNDKQIPTRALTRVFDAATGPNNQLIWIEAPHVAPNAEEIISLLSSNIAVHLHQTYAPPAAP